LRSQVSLRCGFVHVDGHRPANGTKYFIRPIVVCPWERLGEKSGEIRRISWTIWSNKWLYIVPSPDQRTLCSMYWHLIALQIGLLANNQLMGQLWEIMWAFTKWKRYCYSDTKWYPCFWKIFKGVKYA